MEREEQSEEQQKGKRDECGESRSGNPPTHPGGSTREAALGFSGNNVSSRYQQVAVAAG